MIITTSQEHALVSACACSCEMPACPAPRIECQAVEAEGFLYGYLSFTGDTSRWKTTVQTWADGGWIRYTYDSQYRVWINGTEITPAPNVTITHNGGPYTGAMTTTYEDEITPAAGRAAILALIDAAITEEDYTEGPCSSPYLKTIASGTLNPGLELSRTRYRVGIPEDYSTEEAPRSTFEVQWDEVFFPAAWLAWNELKTAYDAALAAHAAWEACELLTPGDCGDEPTVPADPGAAPSPGPSLAEERSWNWSGDTGTPFSGWFTLTLTEEDGETRIVNTLTLCYRSARIGQKPTASGEIHPLA